MSKHRPDRHPAGAANKILPTLMLCTAVLALAIIMDVFLDRTGPALRIETSPDPAWQTQPVSVTASTWNSPCGMRLDTTGLTGQHWHTWRADEMTVTAGDLRFTDPETTTRYAKQVNKAVTSDCDGWTDHNGQRWELPEEGTQEPVSVLAAGTGTAPTIPTITWQAALPGGAGQAWVMTVIDMQVVLVSVDADPLPSTQTATKILKQVTGRTRPSPPDAAAVFV